MPFSDFIGFTLTEFGLDVAVLGFAVELFAGFAVATGFAVVAGFDGELALLDDGLFDELVWFDDELLLVVGFGVLDELPLFEEFVPLFDAMGALPCCLGVRACILASSDAVM